AEVERASSRGKPYDIVFTDQMMPGLGGGGLIARLRAMPAAANVKLVLVSSAGLQTLGKASAALLDAALNKPVRQRELFDCLAKLYTRAGSPEAAGDAASAALASRCAPAASSLKVLLAEDNKINQQFAVALLRKAGYTA